MVRVVSDDAARDLPDIGDAIDAQGRVRPGRVALAFARAPRDAFAFVRGVRRALAALTETTHARSERWDEVGRYAENVRPFHAPPRRCA